MKNTEEIKQEKSKTDSVVDLILSLTNEARIEFSAMKKYHEIHTKTSSSI